MLSTVIDLLLPPTSLALLVLLSLLRPPRRRGRRWLTLVSMAILVSLSLPLVSETLLAALDEDSPATATPLPPGAPVAAIVILSADVDRLRDGTGDVGALTLERERAGAALARSTGLPVLVTGGLVNVPPPVAELMARSMQDDFAITVRWVEAKSPTTWENASYSAPMLRADGISRIYLVTHAWHMRRAIIAFRHAGLDAVPVPVRLDPWPLLRPSMLIPRASSWMRSYFALHEWVGLAYYTWRS